MVKKKRFAIHLTAGLIFLGCALSPWSEVSLPRETVVFTSGSDGYHTFRIPAGVLSPNGDLLAFCEGRKSARGDSGDIDLLMRRSTDGGTTWGPLELVYEEGENAKVTIGNPCPVVNELDDTIWLAFCRNNEDVLVTSSRDDGRHWSKPRDITREVKKRDWDWYATGPGNGIQLKSSRFKGRLVIPCDHRVRVTEGNSWHRAGRSHVIYSDDYGRTWRLGGVTGWAMNESAVVELADGSLMLNMRSYRGSGRRAVSLSHDGGISWSEPRDDETLIEPVCQGSLIRYPQRGKGSRDLLLFSNPASTQHRERLTIRLSYDEGKTWPVSRLLYEGPSGYSDLIALPGNEVGVLYEKDDYQAIVFARFALEWITRSPDGVAR